MRGARLAYGSIVGVVFFEVGAEGGEDVSHVVASALVDDDVGVLFVEGAPLVIQVAEGVALGHDHASVGEVAQPTLHGGVGQAKVDHSAHLLEVSHGGLAVHRAASRGDHGGSRVVAQGQIYGLLNGEKALSPLLGNDAVELFPLPLLNDQIGIHEPIPQGLGGQHTHGALPAGGHADEDDMGLGWVVHDGLRGWLFVSIILHFSFVVKRKDGTKFVRGGGVFWGIWLKEAMQKAESPLK